MTQQLYARDVDGVVVETWPPAGGVLAEGITTPTQAFGAEFGALFTACPTNVLQGWTRNGTTFAAPVAPVPTQGQLQAYANSKLSSMFAVARTYDLGGVSLKCDTTTSTGANLAALNAWGAAAPTATTQWVDDFGVVTQITGAQAVELAAMVIAYGQSVYAILASAMTGIAAGTIATTAQIDALAWPT